MKISILITSIVVGYIIYHFIESLRKKQAKEIAQRIYKKAQHEANDLYQTITETLNRELHYQRKYSQQSLEELRESNENLEQRLAIQIKKNEYLCSNLTIIEEKTQKQQKVIQAAQQKNDNIHSVLEKMQKEVNQVLLACSNYTWKQIKSKFLKEFAETISTESSVYCDHHIAHLSLNAEKLARRISSIAIHRCQFGHWCQAYPSSLYLDDIVLAQQLTSEQIQDIFKQELSIEELKLEYDENTAYLSITANDGCKREIIKQSLIQLVSKKDFQETAVRMAIQASKNKVEQNILEAGEQACKMLGIELPTSIYQLLGRLKYRTSFGQNVLWHSIEVAHIAKLIAYEIGLDPEIASKSGILHDIGKALDHEQEGGHPEIGGELLAQWNERDEVIQGVVGHHEDIQQETPYATLINAADAISASRPGARRETFEKYIKRLEKPESIAYSVSGVENAFAISAGREIRVMVNPEKISDSKASLVANSIANSVENELHYPGKIKITVIREMKVIEYAG